MKEHLWCRWEHAQLPEQWDSAGAPCLDPPPELQAGAQAPYRPFEPDLYEEASQLHGTCTTRNLLWHYSWRITLSSWGGRSPTDDPTVTDGHTVTDTHIVAEIQRAMGGLFQLPIKNQSPPSGSLQGDSVKRQASSPSPTWPRRQVTFEQTSTSGDWQSLGADDSHPLSWA